MIVPLQRIRDDRFTEASAAFLPIEKLDGVANLHQLPAGRCVSLLHVGDYLSIGRSYHKLLDYCAAHDLEIVSDSYEFCINDYITTYDENEYITKTHVLCQSAHAAGGTENCTMKPAQKNGTGCTGRLSPIRFIYSTEAL